MEIGDQSNRGSAEEYEEAVWQEKEEFSRIESGGPCVAREQKYPFELTLKETG